MTNIKGKIVQIDEDLCTGCGNCVQICPRNILYIDEKDNVCKCDEEGKCDKLAGCERVCPEGAIKIK